MNNSQGYGNLNQTAEPRTFNFLSVLASSVAANESVAVKIAQRPHINKMAINTCLKIKIMLNNKQTLFYLTKLHCILIKSHRKQFEEKDFLLPESLALFVDWDRDWDIPEVLGEQNHDSSSSVEENNHQSKMLQICSMCVCV